jgi:hypothetical protein
VGSLISAINVEEGMEDSERGHVIAAVWPLSETVCSWHRLLTRSASFEGVITCVWWLIQCLPTADWMQTVGSPSRNPLQ